MHEFSWRLVDALGVRDRGPDRGRGAVRRRAERGPVGGMEPEPILRAKKLEAFEPMALTFMGFPWVVVAAHAFLAVVVLALACALGWRVLLVICRETAIAIGMALALWAVVGSVAVVILYWGGAFQ